MGGAVVDGPMCQRANVPTYQRANGSMCRCANEIAANGFSALEGIEWGAGGQGPGAGRGGVNLHSRLIPIDWRGTVRGTRLWHLVLSTGNSTSTKSGESEKSSENHSSDRLVSRIVIRQPLVVRGKQYQPRACA